MTLSFVWSGICTLPALRALFAARSLRVALLRSR